MVYVKKPLMKHKSAMIIALFFFCLNVFCLSSVCAHSVSAYTDEAVFVAQDAHSDTNSDASHGADCCGLCGDYGCVNHHSFIYSPGLTVFALNKTNKYPQSEDTFVRFVIPKSIPKPPCSYSLVS